MVTVIVAVGMLVPQSLVRVPVGMPLGHEQGDRRREEAGGYAVRDADEFSQPCDRKRNAKERRSGERHLRARRAEQLRSGNIKHDARTVGQRADAERRERS